MPCYPRGGTDCLVYFHQVEGIPNSPPPQRETEGMTPLLYFTLEPQLIVFPLTVPMLYHRVPGSP